MNGPRPTEPPRGKQAVVLAVTAAARDLFASKGFAAVSVRDIAEAAGVNHGLVHRHFGSKDAVLRAVLQGMFSTVGNDVRSGLDLAAPDFISRLYPLVTERKQDWQILMRAVLDGYDFSSGGFDFPITATVLAHVKARRGTHTSDAPEVAAAIIAGGLGWLLLETYLAPVLGLQDRDPEALRARMAALFASLVDSPPQ